MTVFKVQTLCFLALSAMVLASCGSKGDDAAKQIQREPAPALITKVNPDNPNETLVSFASSADFSSREDLEAYGRRSDVEWVPLNEEFLSQNDSEFAMVPVNNIAGNQTYANNVANTGAGVQQNNFTYDVNNQNHVVNNYTTNNVAAATTENAGRRNGNVNNRNRNRNRNVVNGRGRVNPRNNSQRRQQPRARRRVVGAGNHAVAPWDYPGGTIQMILPADPAFEVRSVVRQIIENRSVRYVQFFADRNPLYVNIQGGQIVPTNNVFSGVTYVTNASGVRFARPRSEFRRARRRLRFLSALWYPQPQVNVTVNVTMVTPQGYGPLACGNWLTYNGQCLQPVTMAAASTSLCSNSFAANCPHSNTVWDLRFSTLLELGVTQVPVQTFGRQRGRSQILNCYF